MVQTYIKLCRIKHVLEFTQKGDCAFVVNTWKYWKIQDNRQRQKNADQIKKQINQK